MGRALTAKQLGFARLVADGLSKTDALQRAYPASKRSRRTARVAACRLSKLPKVAAEIERLVCDRFPEGIDEEDVLGRAVAEMYELSLNGKEMTRLKAAQFLLEYAEAALAMRQSPTQRIADSLAGLYRKARKSQGHEFNHA